jgi:hypothetical protein
MTASRTIRLSPEDNVVVAVDQIVPGTTVAGVSARERVMRGHKMAIAAIKEGEPIRKYGQIIGFASEPIAPGVWVHEHNTALHDFARDTVSPRVRRTMRFCRPKCARHFRAMCGRAERPARETTSAF